MTHRRQSWRLRAPVVLAVAAALTLSACGGSAIPEAADQGAAVSQDGTEATAPDAAAGTAGDVPATGDAGVPAPGETTTAGGAPSAVVPGQANGAGSSSGTAKGGGTGAGKGPAGVAAATGLAGAVQNTLASSPIFGGRGVCKPATLSEIPIGNVSTLSGILGELFAPMVPALTTFVASQNACGGLNGHKIKLYFEDDQGDGSTAITKVQKLVQQNKILAFVGNIQVTTIDAIVPTIKNLGVPIIGGDIITNTWFQNPLIFPQGPGIQSVAYGYLSAIKNDFKETTTAHVWCIEVARACETVNAALNQLAPSVGVEIVRSAQVSLTQPSFVQQCLDFKNSGAKTVILSMDAASDVRFARSCEQVGWFPKVLANPLGVGNQKQFFGNKWLANTIIPTNSFPHMASDTPATKYFQDNMRKYSPGVDTGGAASLGWSAGALLVAASAGLSAENPTTAQLLDALYEFKGQKFTNLGGLSPSPLTYAKGGNPRVPYCLYSQTTNAENNGWSSYRTKPVCTDVIAENDPQFRR